MFRPTASVQRRPAWPPWLDFFGALATPSRPVLCYLRVAVGRSRREADTAVRPTIALRPAVTSTAAVGDVRAARGRWRGHESKPRSCPKTGPGQDSVRLTEIPPISSDHRHTVGGQRPISCVKRMAGVDVKLPLRRSDGGCACVMLFLPVVPQRQRRCVISSRVVAPKDMRQHGRRGYRVPRELRRPSGPPIIRTAWSTHCAATCWLNRNTIDCYVSK
jgi:hypothetical protein